MRQCFDYSAIPQSHQHILPFSEGTFQTLVHTDAASVFSGVSSRTGGLFFDFRDNPLKTGQMGMYFRKAIFLTMSIPMGKS